MPDMGFLHLGKGNGRAHLDDGVSELRLESHFGNPELGTFASSGHIWAAFVSPPWVLKQKEHPENCVVTMMFARCSLVPTMSANVPALGTFVLLGTADQRMAGTLTTAAV